MLARSQDMAIRDVWLETTYRGPSVDPGIETLRQDDLDGSTCSILNLALAC
jgi:hypothetical protein